MKCLLLLLLIGESVANCRAPLHEKARGYVPDRSILPGYIRQLPRSFAPLYRSEHKRNVLEQRTVCPRKPAGEQIRKVRTFCECRSVVPSAHPRPTQSSRAHQCPQDSDERTCGDSVESSLFPGIASAGPQSGDGMTTSRDWLFNAAREMQVVLQGTKLERTGDGVSTTTSGRRGSPSRSWRC